MTSFEGGLCLHVDTEKLVKSEHGCIWPVPGRLAESTKIDVSGTFSTEARFLLKLDRIRTPI